MRGWNIDDTPTTRGTSDTSGGVALPVKVQDERTRVQHEAARTRVTERERERACESSLRAESSFLSAHLSGQLLRYRNRLWPSAHWNRHTWKVKQQAVRFLCLCVFYTHLNPSSSLSLSLTVFATAKVAVLNALNVAQQLECHIANVYLLFVG